MMLFNYSSAFKFTLLLLSVLVSGCPSITKTEVNIEDDKKLLNPSNGAIVLFPTHDGTAKGAELDFIRCLNKNLTEKISKNVKIINTQSFQNHTFPWFEPRYAPNTIEEMNSLLSQAVVRERIASLGIRYLVSIAFSSDEDIEVPGIFCGGGYGGAGCFGVYYDRKMSQAHAAIFDIEGDQVLSLSAKTSGKSYGFAMIVPIMFLAYTEKEACKALSDKLGQLIIDTTD